MLNAVCALPCLALPCLVLPRLALPCLALACRACLGIDLGWLVMGLGVAVGLAPVLPRQRLLLLAHISNLAFNLILLFFLFFSCSWSVCFLIILFCGCCIYVLSTRDPFSGNSLTGFPAPCPFGVHSRKCCLICLALFVCPVGVPVLCHHQQNMLYISLPHFCSTLLRSHFSLTHTHMFTSNTIKQIRLCAH